jgi:hypothetical protein
MIKDLHSETNVIHSQPEPATSDPNPSCDQKHGPPLVFGGIDGGSSGAMAFLRENGSWDVTVVSIVREGSHRLLAINDNLHFIEKAALSAGGRQNLVVAYEKTRKNPMFGTKNNYVSGRNEEFWRVLLTLQQISHYAVDPKTWQSLCFRDIDLPDTKDRAREFLRRRCPATDWLDSYNKAPREAIQDAMCIALWCRYRHFHPELPPAAQEHTNLGLLAPALLPPPQAAP